jgi:methanogenic corrinoid protein MtbC1
MPNLTARYSTALTLSELEQRLQNLTKAVVSGNVDEARLSTYAALARGGTTVEILDAVVEAVNILVDLHEVGEYDQARLSLSEDAASTSLHAIEDRLAKTEGKLNLKVTVGPVGLKAGYLLALVLAATLRTVGFEAVCLSKTQTALDLLRNSEESGADLVIPLFGSDDSEGQLRTFAENIDRGGFKSKFEVIPVTSSLPEGFQTNMRVAKNSNEAIRKATEWALKKRSRRDISTSTN